MEGKAPPNVPGFSCCPYCDYQSDSEARKRDILEEVKRLQRLDRRRPQPCD
jgi:hypothetical protein